MYIGIDNGLNGGIVIIDDTECVVTRLIMPTIKIKKKNEFDVNTLVRFFVALNREYSNVNVMLEQAHVRPISGKRASFTTGFCFGMMQGLMGALGISYEIVSPQTWQKEILKKTGKDSKQESISFCLRKWPSINWCATEKSKKPHDGLTDAACMALYCYRKNR